MTQYLGMGWHRGIIIRGGEYNTKPELKALVQTILRRMFPPESYQYAGVLGTTIKLRITRYKKLCELIDKKKTAKKFN